MTRSKGFTLLEILVVFSVAAVLAGGGFASFVSYSKKQVLDQAAADLKTGIDQAKFNAVSRVKPTVSPCSAATPLSKYRIKVCSPTVPCYSTTDLFEIDAACVVNKIPTWTGVLISKKRASTLTTTVASAECGSTSGTVMQFSVLNGIDAPCRIVLTDGTSSKTVCVDGGGNTSIKDGAVSCGSAYLATTPIPTTPPITLIPTPTTLPDPPSIKSQSATNITATSATLNSTVNPNRGATAITYRYDTSNGLCSALALTLTGPSISGSTDVLPNATNTPSLVGNSIYYYCATADNTAVGGGLTQGINNDNQSFNFLTVPNAPTIVSVGSPTLTSLTVNWTAPAGGVGYYNLFFCDRTANSLCTPSNPVGGNIASGTLSYLHNSGITCGRTYAYTLKGVNSTGSSVDSNVATGGTSWCAAPTVTTNAPVIVNGTTAQLQSAVNPNNDSTTVYYKYGTTYNASCSALTGTTVTYGNIGGGSTSISPNSSSVTLTPGTQYYYCAYATNTLGTIYGSVVNLSICFRDADGDGYGSPSGPFGACGAGYVTNNNDCNDASSAVILGSTRTMYQASGVSCGTACFSQSQTCGAGGVWSGTYSSSSCTASSRTMYNPLSSSCGIYSYTSEVQSCQTSGAWSGSFAYSSPPSAATRTMYTTSLAPCGGSCASYQQFQTCTAGGWSPNTAPYASCSVQSGNTYYRDADGDGYGSASSGSTVSCFQPGGYSSNAADCCDVSSYTYPGSPHYGVPGNGCSPGRDYNCDGGQNVLCAGGVCYTRCTSTGIDCGSAAACSMSPSCGGQNELNCPSGGAYYFACQ